MGLKKLKEHFKIEHIVHKRKDRICIGSPYISEIIAITPEYKVLWVSGLSKKGDLLRYFDDLTEASVSGELKQIIEYPEEYKMLKPVWTYENGRVIKRLCEEYEWPNITTDGNLMYDNEYFKNRSAALKSCRREFLYALKNLPSFWWSPLYDRLKKTGLHTFKVLVYFTRAWVFGGL